MEPEESVVLHAGLPQVLARAVTHHVETDQIVNVIVLKIDQCSRLGNVISAFPYSGFPVFSVVLGNFVFVIKTTFSIITLLLNI